MAVQFRRSFLPKPVQALLFARWSEGGNGEFVAPWRLAHAVRCRLHQLAGRDRTALKHRFRVTKKNEKTIFNTYIIMYCHIGESSIWQLSTTDSRRTVAISATKATQNAHRCAL